MRRTVLVVASLVSVGLAAAPPARAQNPPVTVSVDAAANQRPIDPRIYGVNSFAGVPGLQDLNFTFSRLGGSPSTRYNWQANADNRADDFFFESLPYGSSAASGEADAFVSQTKAAGGEPMITVPIIGWLAKLGPGRQPLCSFSVVKYGPQECTAPNLPDCGNGRLPTGCPCGDCPSQPLVGNDPNDASVLQDSVYQQGFVEHMVNTFGPASGGGVRYYGLDQEYGIWHVSHRDVHPEGAPMDEVRDRMIDYGSRVRATDPGAVILGPEEWNFEGYFHSGFDIKRISAGQCDGFNCPDRVAHGGVDYLPYVLDQLRQYEVATGERVLDVFTVHYYPQGGEFVDTAGNFDDVTPPMQLRRNRSTRSLWDPNYVDETYLNTVIRLVPRLKDWVAQSYPGLQVGINEYSWGATQHINGATAQADVLGILGREGADVAARWVMPPASTPTYKAMKMYRNYDGNRSTFGDVSVAASVPDPDRLAAFAARRTADGKLTVMAVNKVLTGNTPVTFSLAGFTPGGAAEAWQLTAANVIQRLADVPVTGGALSTTLPPQSITLFVVPPGAVPTPTLSIADASVTEGEAGSTEVTFTVTLSQPVAQPVTVDFLTADGTATMGSDFVIGTGTVGFAPGSTSTNVVITVFGDRVLEADETFTVTLSGATQATIADGQAVGTIVDDDPAGLSIADVRVNEGRPARFTVTLAPANPTQTVTVFYVTTDGTATFPADYPFTSGTLTFPPGVTTQTIDVPVHVDSLLEPLPETFVMDLGNPVNAQLAYGQAIASINDRWGGWDFNGDARTDILWRHETSGENVLWFMNGVTLQGGAFTDPPTLTDVRWKMVGTADFNLDGHPDILWRHDTSGENVAWFMNGGTLVSGTFLNPPALSDVRWKMVGTGDFGGDGKPDILWRHDTSGENVIWNMDGITLTDGSFTAPSALTDVNWKMSGVGDYNGDGKPDIVWHHAVSGQIVLWFMDGKNLRLGTFATPSILGGGWRLSGTGDFGGDLKPDFVWRQDGTGGILVWHMDGATRTSATPTNPPVLTDLRWRIVGPR
jgi:hypothetical protein